MDPITTAVIAGATIGLKNIASDAVKDAYGELKKFLAGKLSSLANLEEDPTDSDYQKAAEKEMQKKGLTEDPAILEEARKLIQIIEREPPEKLKAAGIDISGLKAANDVIVKNLHAAAGISIHDIQSEKGTVHIEGVSAGPLIKN